MIERSVGQTCVGIAFVALALAALLARADRESVASVTAVGHVLWGLVLAHAVATQDKADRGRRCLVTAGTLAALGTAEALGAWLCWRAAEPDLALWFLLGLSVAATGIVNASFQEPGDSTFVGQLLFHGLVLLPLVSLAAQGALTIQATVQGTSGTVSSAGPLLRTAVLIGSILVPCLIATLVTALAINLSRQQPRRKGAWTALLAHEAALIVILSRWALTLP